MGEFRMPSLGADMEKGTLVEWRVKPGDTVHRGDIVAVVETEKSTIEIEVFEDGVVGELVAQPGDELPVGAVLATVLAPALLAAAFGVDDERTPSGIDSKTQEVPPRAPLVSSPVVRNLAGALHVDLSAVQGTGAGGRIKRADVERAAAKTAAMPAPVRAGRASPYARRLARESGTDLATMTGSGPGGAVVARDLAAPVTQAAPTPAVVERPGPSRDTTRAAIARVMARAAREIPHYFLATDVDLHRALAWLREANETRPIAERILPAALFYKASARAAREFPGFNGFYRDETFEPFDTVNLGVAIALRGGGLIAPAIQGADTLALDALMVALRDLTARTRARALKGSEIADVTITVTNLGDEGADAVWGVITPPQVAIVGFGRVRDRPWAVDGLLGIRPIVTVTVSGDHRVTDGRDGARFLARIDALLQEPEAL